MKLVSLRCPNCNANVNTEIGNRSTFFCPYCGGKIYVDDDVDRVEVNINQTYRKIDEARIRESENKKAIELKRLAHKERKHKWETIQVIALLLFVVLNLGALSLMGISYDKEQERNIEQGKIQVGTFYEDFEGEKYEAVVKELTARGFTNIQIVDLDDAGLFRNKADTVKSVSINGDNSFSSSSYFFPTDKIIITHH